jgi:hypothetical protein
MVSELVCVPPGKEARTYPKTTREIFPRGEAIKAAKGVASRRNRAPGLGNDKNGCQNGCPQRFSITIYTTRYIHYYYYNIFF